MLASALRLARVPTALLVLACAQLAAAQFGQFFEQMFQGGGGGGGGSHHHGGGGGSGGDSNVGSDSSWFRGNWEAATCSNYLCPATLSCVDKPTHCPCTFPDTQDKFELHPEGGALCLSKSGAVPGLTARKVELARKGLL